MLLQQPCKNQAVFPSAHPKFAWPLMERLPSPIHHWVAGLALLLAKHEREMDRCMGHCGNMMKYDGRRMVTLYI